MDMPDIPEFLKVANRKPSPPISFRPQRKKREKKHPFHLPRSIEPAGLELLRQIEAEKKAKREARFAELRARRR